MDQATHLQSSPPITLDPLSYPTLYRPIRLWLCGVHCTVQEKREANGSVRGKLNDYAFIVFSFHDFPLGIPVRKISSIIPNFPDGLGHNYVIEVVINERKKIKLRQKGGEKKMRPMCRKPPG